MNSVTHSQETQPPDEERTTGGENRHDARARHSIEVALWALGLIVMAIVSYIVHNHPAPWPIELSFSKGLQQMNLGIFQNVLAFFSAWNNPIPSGITLVLWFFGLMIMRWYRQAIFLLLTVLVGDGIDALIGDYVRRPRPSTSLIHVVDVLKYNSFPSGHSEHVVAYYGFLLYLSFTKSVREWRYHWLLLPLQIFGALNILMVGLARLQEGEHWPFDVLGGYLSGLIWLFLFIFLYREVTGILSRRRVAKQEEMVQVQVRA